MKLSSKRKKRFAKDLRTLDPESQEYWDEILRREGLSMSSGSDPRTQYRGMTSELETQERKNAASLLCGGGRRVKPKGSKPDGD